MPTYYLQCPDCGHRFTGMVFAGARPPQRWVCSACGGERAAIRPEFAPIPHPLEALHGGGCPCCGGTIADHHHD